MSEILDWEIVKCGDIDKPQENKLLFIWTQITGFSIILEDLFVESKLKFQLWQKGTFNYSNFFKLKN